MYSKNKRFLLCISLLQNIQAKPKPKTKPRNLEQKQKIKPINFKYKPTAIATKKLKPN